jgi:phosphatidylinositol alpha-mannosyltransferase
VRKIGVRSVTVALSHTSAAWAVVGVALMSEAMLPRAVSWHVALRAALPRAGLRLVDAMRGLFIGVLVSSTLPANLGEPSRVLVVARRTKQPWENLPIVAGTLISQSLLNVVAVIVLGVVTLGSVDLGSGAREGLIAGAAAAVLVLALVLVAPVLLGQIRKGSRLQRTRAVASRVRSGLTVFRHPRTAVGMVGAQMSAWGLQWLAVYVLLVATHLGPRVGPLGAAAVLCAVNVTMLLPATPGDVGVFQAAVAAVLHVGWNVSYGDGIAYGVILQSAELLTALLMGVPALVGEGLSWRHMGLGARADRAVTLPRPVTAAAPCSVAPPP